MGAAEATLLKEEEKAKECKKRYHDKLGELKAKKGADCQWMFGDAGQCWGKIGLGGLGGKLAQMNPARWSQKTSMATIQEQLEAVAQDEKEKDRPIKLKVFDEGQPEREDTHDKVMDAVNWLKQITDNQDPALKPLEAAAAEASSRVEDAKKKVENAQTALERATAAAKEAGAM